MFGLTEIDWILLAVSAIIIGFGKTGITGATLPAVAMVAYVFGGKLSSGVMLTALIMSDIPAIVQYGKHGKLDDVFKLLLPSVAGIVLGAVVGHYLNDKQFKFIMGIAVLICLILLLYREVAKKDLQVPKSKWVPMMVGVVAGFTSMVGNAAGPVLSVYLISMAFERQRFLGTAAWFFFFVNLIKVPFHVFMWGTITFDTIKYTLIMIPFIIIGALVGVYFVKRINEQIFKWLVIVVTFISAINLMM